MIKKLIEVQAKLNAPKNQYNSFGKYNYRNCEDILEAVKPLLREVGLVLTISDEVVTIGDRYYVKATASVTDGTGRFSATALARESDDKKGMDAAQVTGATSSYARKYALNGLFLIDDNKDADTDENHIQAENKAKAEQPKPKPIAKSKNIAAETAPKPSAVCEICGKPILSTTGKPLSDALISKMLTANNGHLYCSAECKGAATINTTAGDLPF